MIKDEFREIDDLIGNNKAWWLIVQNDTGKYHTEHFYTDNIDEAYRHYLFTPEGWQQMGAREIVAQNVGKSIVLSPEGEVRLTELGITWERD